jgi:hypothetical protein
MGLSGHFHTLQNLCVYNEPLGNIQHEAAAQKACFDGNCTKICIEQYDLIVLFLQDILHTSHLPSRKYKKSLGWGAVLLKSVTYS